MAKGWWRIIVIALGFSFLYAMIHGVLPSDGNSSLPPSIIVQQGLLPVAFILYGTLWFGLLAWVFVRIERLIPGGRRLARGLVYGLFFCVIILALYLEPLPNVSTFGLVNISWMLADSVPLILFGGLLGIFLGRNQPVGVDGSYSSSKMTKSELVLILVIPAIFMVGRLFSYTMLGVTSNLAALPVNTIAWVVLFGLVTGVAYVLMIRPAVKKSSPVSTALFFGLVVFGLYIFLFNFAYALIVALDGNGYLDFFERTGVDVASITMGILLYETLRGRFGQRQLRLMAGDTSP